MSVIGPIPCVGTVSGGASMRTLANSPHAAWKVIGKMLRVYRSGNSPLRKLCK